MYVYKNTKKNKLFHKKYFPSLAEELGKQGTRKREYAYVRNGGE